MDRILHNAKAVKGSFASGASIHKSMKSCSNLPAVRITEQGTKAVRCRAFFSEGQKNHIRLFDLLAQLNAWYKILMNSLHMVQKTQLRKLWDTLRSSYWFVPSAMLAAVAILWLITNWTDPLLTIAATQFGPRLPRNFLRDTGIQTEEQRTALHHMPY